MSGTYLVIEPGFNATPGITISMAEVYNNDLLITDAGEFLTDDDGNQLIVE
jgi:hypothetical protein